VPSAAAIANALYDATGVRFREPPFTPEKVRAALAEHGLLIAPDPSALPASATPDRNAGNPARRWRWSFSGLGAGIAAGIAIAAPWRPAMAPATPPPADFYSAQTLERGRLVAAAGDCAVCHTAPGGATNAGGRAMETPFGTVYSTNITSDPKHGIGTWSLAAFTRAMREGISRDGRHLYPAFPYTSFAKLDDADIEALYAYLMNQPGVPVRSPETRLAFPFNMRSGMALWNAAFHDPRPFREDPARSPLWNRGAYLVEGAGHCSACHSPRNAAGAEVGGRTLHGGASRWLVGSGTGGGRHARPGVVRTGFLRLPAPRPVATPRGGWRADGTGHRRTCRTARRRLARDGPLPVLARPRGGGFTQSNAEGNDQAVRLERLAQTQAVSLAPSRGARHSRPPARSAMSKGPFPRLACALRSQSTAPYAHPFPTT
jgi:mono/diheme cytochrome c family protein